jgi:hypothetical protein
VTQNGDLVIDETDGVTVISLSTFNGDIFLQSALNDVTLTGLAGTAISAGGGGNILVESADAVIADAVVTSVGMGHITIIAGGALTLNNGGNLTTTGGTLNLQSGASVAMAETVTLQSGGTNVRVSANDNITVSLIDAGATGVVSLIATNGSIMDNNDAAAVDVIASALRLFAGKGVGATPAGVVDVLEVTVDTIAAQAGVQGLFLEATGNLLIDSVGNTVTQVNADNTTSAVIDVALTDVTVTDSGQAYVTTGGDLTVAASRVVSVVDSVAWLQAAVDVNLLGARCCRNGHGCDGWKPGDFRRQRHRTFGRQQCEPTGYLCSAGCRNCRR